MAERRFTDPHEIETIPGTEGWQEMYPYYLLFNKEPPELAKWESSRFWFLDNIHCPRPMYPLDPSLACDMNYSGIGAIANRALMLPDFKSLYPRIVNGYNYVHSFEPETQEEVERRAKKFEPRISYIYENWNEFYTTCIREADRLIEEMKKLEFSELIEEEPESIMSHIITYYPVHNLYDEYLKLWSLMVQMSQQTKKILLPSYGADLVFVDSARRLFPGISDEVITQLVQGFESILFRGLDELQKLAQSAVDLGISEALLNSVNWDEASSTLQLEEAGRKWLEQFEAARDPWFEMSTGEGWQKYDVAWNDDLDYPFAKIKDYVESLKVGKRITRPKEEVLKRRDKITEEYRDLISNEDDRNAFERLLGLTRMVSAATEDHSVYQSSWFHNLYCRKLRRIGELLVHADILKDNEDVFLLNKSDLDSVVWELYTSWARGVPPVSKYYWPKKIERRREIIERFRDWIAPPALGLAPEAVTSANTIVNFGITTELVNSWLEAGAASEEEAKELKGFAVSVGVVVGTARVCRYVEDTADLKPGEIMVTPSTAPAWAPAFQIAGGCVTDMGGLFSHTAIVAREYGLPAVVGTGYATARIKTGDKIRLDGGEGIVTIVERAK